MHWLIFLLLGAVSGWITGLIMKGRGYGLLGNIVIGVVGGIIGGYVLGWLDITVGNGIGGRIVTCVIGAITLVGVINILSPKKS
jgi:uncharacterized membrane protein YeaQ/YmgE (transglycosylase-associated protein family)